MTSYRRTLTEMKDRPDLDRLLREAVAAFAALSPERQEAELRKQRESWCRQDMD